MTAPGEGAVGEVVLAGSAKRSIQRPMIPPTGSNCVACRRPTPRWSAICRQCLAAHYRLDGLIRSYEILTEVAS